jgi:hypothetical protein
LCLLVFTISWWSYRSEVNDHLESLKQRQKYSIETQAFPLKHEFQSIVADLKVISTLEVLKRSVDNPSGENLAALSREFLSISAAKTLYDQIRYIDSTGTEIVRVNFNNGHPYICPRSNCRTSADAITSTTPTAYPEERCLSHHST